MSEDVKDTESQSVLLDATAVQGSLENKMTRSEAFDKLLDNLQEKAYSQRDKGTLFEQLMLLVFKIEPLYRVQFSDVQPYTVWAKSHPELTVSTKDIGIDLVATLRSPENEEQCYVAIQCKFYGRDKKVPKGDIDSFLSASGQKCFASRILVATNSSWTENAALTYATQEKPVQIISREMLLHFDIDWVELLKSGQVKSNPKRQPRQYQLDAVSNTVKGFETYDRGKLIMACGTGKTFTSLKIAEAQVKRDGLVLFLVPSLPLLAQTMNDWVQQSSKLLTAIPVCSDSTIGHGRSINGEEDFAALLAKHDLAYPATTNAERLYVQVKDALQRSGDNDSFGLTVVFSTYQSIEVIHEAQKSYGIPDFDLIICDEAHRTAGAYFTGINNTEVAGKGTSKKGRKRKAQTVSTTPSLGGLESEPAPQNLQPAVAQDLDDESAFTLVHHKDYVHAAKRLYMTATPKIYGQAPKEQQEAGLVSLYSMDNEDIFGPVFFALNFDMAVKLGCLVDYKVLILVSDKKALSQEELLADFSQNQAARVIGTWKALNKYGVEDNLSTDAEPMQRAVAFAQRIDLKGMRLGRERDLTVASKQFAGGFQDIVDRYKSHVTRRGEQALANHEQPSDDYLYLLPHGVTCDCKHIDGSMDSVTKSDILNWLREKPEESHCKLLFNVRCLSEGVDVPSLDAVVFLSPRKSQVEVVQIIGRVMRTAPNKKRGYVIIPVVTDNPDAPEETLANNPDFRIVWEMLGALKSINPNHVLVDSYLNKLDDRISIICHSNKEIQRKSSSTQGPNPSGGTKESVYDGHVIPRWNFDEAAVVEEKIKSIIVNKVGNRREWEDWAQDVGEICTRQVAHIKELLGDNAASEHKQAFARFKHDLTVATQVDLSDDDVVEMLAQHIVIRPVLDELFRGYPFTEKNGIARAMSRMVELLDQEGLTKTNEELRGFYASVGFRMKNVTTLSDRQKVIVELFDRFFKVAFPKQQDKLGIVYTPVEVVDFIIHSVNDILKKEFACSFTTPGVHVLDPFTGTGTFLARLLQSSLISATDLQYKYTHDLHAFEILPLAYYIASINIEATFAELYAQQHDGQALSVDDYQANNIVVLTDTFSDGIAEKELFADSSLGQNLERRKEIENKDLRVIIGNPPYSVGQSNQNDDNKNESYPLLDERIADTYVKYAKNVTLKNSLYDSYIRAFRWASDKLGNSGVISFVTNAGWLDSVAANGMRHCLQQEFSSIHVFHLKGNQRTSGEQSRKEGGKIFGSGSRTPIAITVLVKNPETKEQGKIYFASVDDYLSREQKLEQLKQLGSVLNPELKFNLITPDVHNDWLNQRREDFEHFISVDGKTKGSKGIWKIYSQGVKTNRDAWSFNASPKRIEENFTRCITFYNEQVAEAKRLGESFKLDKDVTKIKWDDSLERNFSKRRISPEFNPNLIRESVYRPFVKLFLYNDKTWIARTSQMPKLFPFDGSENLVIGVAGKAASTFSCLVSSHITCFDCVEKAQWLPRYIYSSVDAKAESKATQPEQGLLFEDPEEESGSEKVVVNGYMREDALAPEAIEHFRAAYKGHEAEIDADAVFFFIYGILHSKEYRETYQNNLQKELPRIPRVATFEEFKAFEEAGRKLAKLHADYEQVEPYAGCTITGYKKGMSREQLRVTQLKYGKISGKIGNAAMDKTTIIYNSAITISGIPLEAQEYVVNKKSALDWIVGSCGVSVDKESQIINDYNDMADANDDPEYILKLILRIITVSLETMKIVNSLPALHIHELDQ